MTEVAGDGEQLQLASPETAAIALLRANHAAFVALQPILVDLLESGNANEGDIEAVYEICGNTWTMLEAIHEATQLSSPEPSQPELVIVETPVEDNNADTPVAHEAPITPPAPVTVQEAKPEPESARVAFAASLALPDDFEDRVESLLEQYDGCVNIAAVVRQILQTERLASSAFNELGRLLNTTFGLEHTGHGFYKRPKEPNETTATNNHNGNLDSQIQQAIGRGSVPIWKPKQRGRYSKS